MAISDAELSIIIEAQNKASAVLRQVQKDVANLGNAASQPNKAFGGLFDTIKAGLGVAAGFGIFNTAANALSSGARSAIDFEKSMSGVRAVSGATGEQFKQLTNLALELGKNTAFSAGEAARGIEELVKGGVSLADIMGGAATASLNLAAAGGVSLGEAAEIAANAMSQFGLKGADMAKVSDLVAGAANASSLSVGEFRQSLGQVGAVANAAGQSFEQTATAIAVMGAAGIKGSDAGTSLKTLLLSLSPATDKAAGAMRDLGIITADGANRFFDAQGKVKDLSQIAGVLQETTRGLTEQQKLQRLETIFGSDAMRAAVIVADAGEKGFADMAGAMGKVTAEAVALQRLDNVAGDLEQLRGSAETLGIVLLQTAAPAFRALLQRATEFTNRFTQEAQTIIQTARNIASEHGIGLIQGAIVAIEDRLKEVFGPTVADVFHDVIEAVGNLGTAFGNVKDALEPFARDFAAWVGSLVPGAVAKIRDVTGGLKDMGGALRDNALAMDVLKGAAGGLLALTALGGVVKVVGAIGVALLALNPVTLIIGAAVVALGIAWSTNFLGIQDVARKTVEDIGRGLALLRQDLDTLGGNLGRLGERAQEAWATIGRVSEELVKALNAAAADGIEGFGKRLQRIPEMVGEAFRGIVAEVDKALPGFRAALGQFGAVLEGLPGPMGALGRAIGAAVGDGLIAGIKLNVGAAYQAGLQLAQAATSAMQNTLEARSPSRVAEELGEDVVEGFAGGLEENREAIEAAEELAGDVLTAVEEILAEAPRTLGQLAGDLGAALGATFDRAMIPLEQAEEEFRQKREDAQRKHLLRMRDLEEDLLSGPRSTGKARETVLENIREQEERFNQDMERLVQDRGDRIVDLERQQAERRGRAIRSFVDDFDTLTRDVERRAAEIGENTGRAINEAIDETGRGIEQAKEQARRSISELRAALDASRDLRARRDTFAGGQTEAARIRAEGLEEAALRERNRLELEEFDRQQAADSLETLRRERARRQEDADARFDLERDLQEAETDEERDQIRARFDLAVSDLRRRRQIEDAERQQRAREDRKLIEDRLEQEQKALARRRALEADDRKFREDQAQKLQDFNDLLADEDLQKQIRRIEEERDQRIDALNEALAAKEHALRESERKERELLVRSYEEKVADLKKHLLGEVGTLLGEGQAALDVFLSAIIQRTADTMKTLGIQSGGGAGPAPGGAPLRPGGKPGETPAEVVNYYQNLGQAVPPEVMAGPNWPRLGPEAGALAGQPVGTIAVSQLEEFQSGGIVSGRSGAARLAVVHGGEGVFTPEQMQALVRAGAGGAAVAAVTLQLDGATFARAVAPLSQDEQNRLVRLRVV